MTQLVNKDTETIKTNNTKLQISKKGKRIVLFIAIFSIIFCVSYIGVIIVNNFFYRFQDNMQVLGQKFNALSGEHGEVKDQIKQLENRLTILEQKLQQKGYLLDLKELEYRIKIINIILLEQKDIILARAMLKQLKNNFSDYINLPSTVIEAIGTDLNYLDSFTVIDKDNMLDKLKVLENKIFALYTKEQNFKGYVVKAVAETNIDSQEGTLSSKNLFTKIKDQTIKYLQKLIVVKKHNTTIAGSSLDKEQMIHYRIALLIKETKMVVLLQKQELYKYLLKEIKKEIDNCELLKGSQEESDILEMINNLLKEQVEPKVIKLEYTLNAINKVITK